MTTREVTVSSQMCKVRMAVSRTVSEIDRPNITWDVEHVKYLGYIVWIDFGSYDSTNIYRLQFIISGMEANFCLDLDDYIANIIKQNIDTKD